MPNFNPPNPYGSYFNFGSTYGGDPSPEQWRNPNYPNLSIPTSQGVASAMGSPSGGINPTQQEFLESRRRDIAYQQFIDRSVKEDARTRTIGNMVMQGIYGNDMRSRMGAMARIGGADAYAGMIGTMINTPGISGYLGGSVRSLAVGSLAASTSGLTMNGYGVFGDKGMNMRFADNLMQNIGRQFYGANGNPNLAMTNGLNRDQMGGVMVQAASQGAFAGLDMGTFQKLDQAGNRAKFIANEGTTQKITDFLKNTTKALSSLIDVYGNISSGELMQKAQEITGLDMSRLDNAKLMADRLQKLRDTARVTGIDTASMFDMSARVGNYATSIGVNPGFAGTVGTMAASQGMMEFRMRQMNTHGFYAPSMTPVESGMSVARDIAAMSRDPLGSRLAALEIMIRNSGMSGSDASALRGQASALGATGAGVAGLEQLARSRFGMSLAGTIRSMGGADNMLGSLDPTAQANVFGMLNTNFGQRQSNLLRSMMGRSGMFSSNAQMNAMHQVVTTFDNDSIESMLNGGDMDSLMNPVLGTGGDRAGLRAAMMTVRGMGGTAYHMTRDMIQSNPLLRRMMSTEAQRRNAYMNIGTAALPDGFRGSMLGGGFAAGMLDKFSGNDPLSQLQWMAAVRPELVGGVTESVDFNAAHYQTANGGVDLPRWAANMANFKHGLNRTNVGRGLVASVAEGGLGLGILGPQYNPLGTDKANKDVTAMLLRLHGVFSDPSQLQSTMSGFNMYMNANGRGAFITKQDIAAKMKYGDNALLLKDLADAEERMGTSSSIVGSIRQQAQMLADGRIFRTNGSGGLFGRAIGKGTNREADRANSDSAIAGHFMQFLMDPHLKLDKANSDLIARYAGTTSGSLLSSQIKSQLDTLSQAVDTDVPWWKGGGTKYGAEKDKFRKALDLLGTAGPTAKRDDVAPQISRIAGDLILRDNDGKNIGTGTFGPRTTMTSDTK